VLGGFAAPPDDVVNPLYRAFLEEQVLAVRYRDMAGRQTARRIEPHLLLLSYPVWYLVAWDRERQGVRSFRCDRFLAAEVVGEAVTPRPRQAFSDALEGSGAITP
jgi:predicted DNA-binding transcriptional regulator YafY